MPYSASVNICCAYMMRPSSFWKRLSAFDATEEGSVLMTFSMGGEVDGCGDVASEPFELETARAVKAEETPELGVGASLEVTTLSGEEPSWIGSCADDEVGFLLTPDGLEWIA